MITSPKSWTITLGKKGIGRALFCTLKGEEIVILHSFIKKTRKTPKRELEKARVRLKGLR